MADHLHVNPNSDLAGQSEPLNFLILPRVNNNSSSPPACDYYVSDAQDSSENAEMTEAGNAGIVDPNPFNVLTLLLGLLGELKFAKAIDLVRAKISIFSDLARGYIEAAAKRGNKGTASEGRAVLSKADSSDIALDVAVNYTEGDVEKAFSEADKVVKGISQKQSIERKILVLNNKVKSKIKPSLREELEKTRADLKDLFKI